MTNPPEDSRSPMASAPSDRTSSDERQDDGASSGNPIRLDGAFPRADADDWGAAAEASLRGGATLEGLARETLDGLGIDVLYHESSIQGRRTPSTSPSPTPSSSARTVGAAPEAPAWDNRLCVLGDTPDTMAAHALAGLAGGVMSLELSVGASGSDTRASLAPLDALPRALDGVHLDMITLSLRAGDDTEAALDAVLALHGERDIDPATARLELDADPLGELARHGRVRGGAGDALGRLADLAARAARELPVARVVAVDTVVHHAAGASPCQELVAAIATGTDYLDALLDAGIAPEAACRTLVFRVALDADIVGGVVKLRALERLWSHALASAGLPVVRPYVVVETSRRHLSRLAPWVNHLRNVAACTAAAIGGADTVTIHPHDRVDGRRVGTDDVVADRVARNLPILLAEEGGLLAVEDAAGGAHAIESLTGASVAAAWTALGELQRRGGLGAALASGAWQADIARSHAVRVERLAGGESVRVGVNRFRHDGVDAPAASIDHSRVAGAGGTGDERRTDDADAPVAPLAPVREARAFEGDPVTGDAATEASA